MCYNFLEYFSECLIGLSIGTLFLYASGYHNRQCAHQNYYCQPVQVKLVFKFSDFLHPVPPYPIISISIATNVMIHKQRQKINFLFSFRIISVAIVVICLFPPVLRDCELQENVL